MFPRLLCRHGDWGPDSVLTRPFGASGDVHKLCHPLAGEAASLEASRSALWLRFLIGRRLPDCSSKVDFPVRCVTVGMCRIDTPETWAIT